VRRFRHGLKDDPVKERFVNWLKKQYRYDPMAPFEAPDAGGSIAGKTVEAGRTMKRERAKELA
jgi:hypothetical protein